MQPSFSKNLGPLKIHDIEAIIDCDVKNIPDDTVFNHFLGTKSINKNTLTFLHDHEIINNSTIEETSLICTQKKFKTLNLKQKAIIVDNVQEAVAKLSNSFYRDYTSDEILKFNKPIIGHNCNIANSAIIENGTIIGNNVKIGHGVFLGHNCIIGDECNIEANAVISNTLMSENVFVGRNSSLGKKGFGFFIKSKKNIEIYHLGRVILQSNVFIGSNCTIDRGSFDDTCIGENTFLDNLCHIAHNVHIGNDSAFAAMTGIAGSTKIGNSVLTGGQVGIAGHLKIGNKVQIAAKSGVFSDIQDGESVMGNPAINKYRYIKSYKKNYGK